MSSATHTSVFVRFLAAAAVLSFLTLFGVATTARAESDGPDLAEAQAAAICDDNGNVLWEKNGDTELPMASITKIMTAMVALDSNTSMDTVCTITDVDLGSESQEAGFANGSTVTFRELMTVMLVYSANDAAENIAIQVAGSEQAFVERMNEKAQELGMTHTHFSNPHGLEADGHHSCAVDLIKMGRYALSNYPFIASTVKKRSCTVNVNGTQSTFESTDELMDSYKGLIGIKTGSVQSGTAFLGAAERRGIRLYSAVLGCETDAGRFTDSATMLDWGFSQYRWTQLATSSRVLRYANFAFHFGFVCPVYSDVDSYGYVDPSGGDVSFSKVFTRPSILVVPGDPYGAEVWTQDGRLVGATSYSAGALLRVPAFGTFDTGFFYQQPRADAA